jgi:uncharacterized protein (TIGR02996 family)
VSWLEELEVRLQAEPEDWVSRRVYADWLIDQGDVRGQILHLEVELQRAKPSTAARRRLQRQLRALVVANQRAWLGGCVIPEGILLEWSGGSSWRLRLVRDVSSQEIHEAIEALSQHPGEVLPSALDVSGVSAWRLLEHELPPALTSLTLSREQLRPWISAPGLRSITRLDLSHSGLLAPNAAVLVRSTALGGLTSLDLRHNGLGSEGAITLARSDAFPALVSLDLRHNGIGPEGAAALARARLGTIRLEGNPTHLRGKGP